MILTPQSSLASTRRRTRWTKQVSLITWQFHQNFSDFFARCDWWGLNSQNFDILLKSSFWWINALIFKKLFHFVNCQFSSVLLSSFFPPSVSIVMCSIKEVYFLVAKKTSKSLKLLGLQMILARLARFGQFGLKTTCWVHICRIFKGLLTFIFSEYQRFLSTHCMERQYLFQTKNEFCCRPKQLEFLVPWLPDPVRANADHYKPPETLIGQATTDNDRPSATNSSVSSVAEDLQVLFKKNGFTYLPPHSKKFILPRYITKLYMKLL